MSGRVLAALALALAVAAGSAAAYVRTADPGTGAAISWPTPVVPYHVSSDWPDANTAPSCRSGAPLAEVRRGFTEWEQDCTELRLLFGGEAAETSTGLGGSRENVVVFRRGWCSQVVPTATDACWSAGDCPERYGCFDDGCAWRAGTCGNWGILAQTSVLYDPSTGRIFDADMELNGWDGTAAAIPPAGTRPSHGWYFTCHEPDQPSTVCTTYGQPDCKYIDLRNTVTHEVGHFIGLKHPCTGNGAEPGLPDCSSHPTYAERTMYPFSSAGDVVKRDLSDDDRAGVCEIYPRSSGGCGCGGGGAAGTLSLLVAALALRRRAAGFPLPQPRGGRGAGSPRDPQHAPPVG